MVTQLYGDVASRPTRSQRAARLFVARLQPDGAGLGVETKRCALGPHLSLELLVDDSSSSQSHGEIQNIKTG